MAKTISERQRLEAFALYTMATHHYEKCREFERAASEIIGFSEGLDEFNESISDGIYGHDAGRSQPFDRVLEAAGVTVRKPKRKGK